jgi:Raf kinase inhibitor-like YbhB/YbcL family protein
MPIDDIQTGFFGSVRKAVRRSLIPALLLIGLASCGSHNKPRAAFQLTSGAFANGGALPAQFACDGGKRPPPLGWSAPPTAVRSLALVLDDPDAPGATFGHWGLYDLPPTLRAASSEKGPAKSAINDFGYPGYGAPCPPKGDKPHHYRFKLYALDVDHLRLGPNPKVADVDDAAQRHAIGTAQLMGTYQRR